MSRSRITRYVLGAMLTILCVMLIAIAILDCVYSEGGTGVDIRMFF